MSKTKIASALTAVALLTFGTAVHAEDAASASYQMRMAANDGSAAETDGSVRAVDPDQPRPIKLKLHHYRKKTSRTAAAIHAAPRVPAATAEAGKTN